MIDRAIRAPMLPEERAVVYQAREGASVENCWSWIRRSARRAQWIVVAIALALVVPGGADELPAAKAKAAPAGRVAKAISRAGKRDSKLNFTPAREAAALTFARSHHPELIELLDQLRLKTPSQYEEAILDLFETSEMLAAVQSNDTKRYELMLDSWKVSSRIDVLAAKISQTNRDSSSRPEMVSELRSLLGQQVDATVALRKLDRERAEAQLKRIDAQLSQLEGARERMIENRLQRLTGRAAKLRPKENPAKPAKAIAAKVGENTGNVSDQAGDAESPNSGSDNP